jgi:hypothetical protein
MNHAQGTRSGGGSVTAQTGPNSSRRWRLRKQFGSTGSCASMPCAENELLARQIPPRDASIRHGAMPDPAPGVTTAGNRS